MKFSKTLSGTVSLVVAIGLAGVAQAGPVSATAVAASTPAIPVYPPGGATWRRDGALSLYKLTEPAMGTSAGPQRWGVLVWQEALREIGYAVPMHGRYDAETAAAVSRYQARAGFPVTGEINFPVARALLAPTIRREAQRVGMPPGLLCGHLLAESFLDPQAVGTNGVDLGIAQISVTYHPSLTEQDFFDDDSAIRYMAERDLAAHEKYGNWSIAIASYNSPARARAWARTGTPDDIAAAYAVRAWRGCGPLTAQVAVTTETSLWRFAVTQLGDGLRWPELAKLNRLPSTARLQPGQLLTLPKP